MQAIMHRSFQETRRTFTKKKKVPVVAPGPEELLRTADEARVISTAREHGPWRTTEPTVHRHRPSGVHQPPGSVQASKTQTNRTLHYALVTRISSSLKNRFLVKLSGWFSRNES